LPIPTPNPRLLIIEDDPATSNALRRIFARSGWSVAVASTVAEGCGHLETAPHPDWIILDLMLPDGEGTEILRMIRRDAIQVRVAVTTGMSDTARLDVVRKLNPDMLLSKPINLSELFKTLVV